MPFFFCQKIVGFCKRFHKGVFYTKKRGKTDWRMRHETKMDGRRVETA